MTPPKGKNPARAAMTHDNVRDQKPVIRVTNRLKPKIAVADELDDLTKVNFAIFDNGTWYTSTAVTAPAAQSQTGAGARGTKRKIPNQQEDKTTIKKPIVAAPRDSLIQYFKRRGDNLTNINADDVVWIKAMQFGRQASVLCKRAWDGSSEGVLEVGTLGTVIKMNLHSTERYYLHMRIEQSTLDHILTLYQQSHIPVSSLENHLGNSLYVPFSSKDIKFVRKKTELDFEGEDKDAFPNVFSAINLSVANITEGDELPDANVKDIKEGMLVYVTFSMHTWGWSETDRGFTHKLQEIVTVSEEYEVPDHFITVTGENNICPVAPKKRKRFTL